uniref:Cytochrome P450 n=1 Tax=Physcomitrium patens TaxID=3218 RepID=A0A2K1JPM7_PHYPA|nr:hypothetical protein PHYPA_015873 [Physcomitrium patens]
MEGLHYVWEQVGAHTGVWTVGATLLAVLTGWLLWSTTAVPTRNPPVPPGSFGWPLVGETLDQLDAAKANQVVKFYATRVAKYGEVFRTHFLFNPAVSMGAPEGNKFLFGNENKLVQNSWPGPVTRLLGKNSLTVLVGEEHKRARRVYTTFFNPEGLQASLPRIEAIVRRHAAEYWEGKDQILGVPTAKEFAFTVAADLFMSMDNHDPLYRLFAQAHEEFVTGFFKIPIYLPGSAPSLTKEEGINPPHDLLNVMLTVPYENDSFMTDDAIKDNILLMMTASHDTSSTTIAFVLKYLYLNPECLKEVIREQLAIAKDKRADAAVTWEDTKNMKYTWRAIQETMRLQPPVQAGFRRAIKDFEFGGFSIPKGWTLIWSVARSHMSPKFFPDPEKFDPSRFEGSGPPPYVFIPFGGGPHICLGNEFARLEMLLFLHHIVLNYEWEMVDPNEQVSITPVTHFKKGLELILRKRRFE